jgi:uncharacterized alpha-E superfamily protein
MLSRVAENLYWFSRYLKRTENTARLVAVNSLLQLDLPRGVRFAWQPMLEIVGAADAFHAAHPEAGEGAAEADVVRFLLLEETNPCSMLSSVKQARDALRTIRETLPQESWECVNGTFLWLGEHGERGLGRRYRLDLLNRVIDDCLVVSGILTANVSRDLGFQFLRLGTALEQADMTTRIIDAGASGLIEPRAAQERNAYQALQWMSVLRSLAAYEMYRRHVRERVRAVLALEFLLQNREFPRSVMFCLTRMQAALPQMPVRRGVERALARATALARDADTRTIAEGGVPELMDEIQIAIAGLHEAIRETYFRA